MAISILPPVNAHNFNALRTPSDVDIQDPKGFFFQEVLTRIEEQDKDGRGTRADVAILAARVGMSAESVSLLSLTLQLNRFGNYAMQILIRLSSADLLRQIVNLVTASTAFEMCLHPFGTHCIQAMIVRAGGNTDLEAQLGRLLDGHAFRVSSDKTGIHVILCILRHWQSHSTDFIVADLLSSTDAIQARDAHLRRIKASLERGENTAKIAATRQTEYFSVLQQIVPQLGEGQQRRVAEAVAPFVEVLGMDGGTSYLVTTLVKGWREDSSRPSTPSFFSSFLPSLSRLSTHRVGSTIIELIISSCDPTTLSQIVGVFTSSLSLLTSLCLDEFGHSVILRVLGRVSNESERRKLSEMIMSAGNKIGSNQFGQRVLTRLGE
ncbi:hypothetical protein BLNAU_20164 [Blattamonas nauphoetae]|uniref:PUM-HD domain-containing protein n=1 Tax=Blattamonas nauphoetae TaxID=2049346 RepID=A0ABQ9X2S1_9EUKA|nr:hypothetical protein BLNAU_20164 [Blattamonas nauphoetae]